MSGLNRELDGKDVDLLGERYWNLGAGSQNRLAQLAEGEEDGG